MRVFSITLVIAACLLVVATACSNNNMSNDVIAACDEYIVTGDSVVEGEFVAYAPSRTSIVSNFRDTVRNTPMAPVPVRLAFNMRDNELPQGLFHMVDPTTDTVLIVAGEPQEVAAAPAHVISPDTRCTLKVDLTAMERAFSKDGVYITATGDSIFSDEFNGVWVMGNVSPLSWSLASLSGNNRTKLRKSQEPGFYELDVTFAPTEYARSNIFSQWSIDEPNGDYPRFTSHELLVDAIYNMSINTINNANFEELPTSQLSLAVMLSLAYLKPDLCQKLLRSKVHNRIIDQDPLNRYTFPVVNDRLIWTAAAWHVYCANGDKRWLKYAYDVTLNTLQQFEHVVFCDHLFLVHGCDSYSNLETQYPRWMQPKDYFESLRLSTNVIYAHSLYLLSLMAEEMGINGDQYYTSYQRMKDSINQNMWNESRGRYCSYLINEASLAQSTQSCNISQAACILFNIADDGRATTLLSHTPIYTYGIPTTYPADIIAQGQDFLPFVQAMWNMAAATYGNMDLLRRGLAALYRHIAFYGFANTDYTYSEQVLNACATAAMTLKAMAGIEMSPEGIEFNPVVPQGYKGSRKLRGITYRGATFDLTLHGNGNAIKEIMLNGKPCNSNFFPAGTQGHHLVEITLTSNPAHEQNVVMAKPTIRPFTPYVTWNGDSATIINYNPQLTYSVTIGNHTYNGVHRIFAMPTMSAEAASCMAYVSARSGKISSHISMPHIIAQPQAIATYSLAKAAIQGTTLLTGNLTKQVVEFTPDKNSTIKLQVNVDQPGTYFLDLYYSNGATTTRATPMCKVTVNTHPQDELVLPQRGVNQWHTFGYTNMISVPLLKGSNTIVLQYDPATGSSRKPAMQPIALLHHLRLIKQ